MKQHPSRSNDRQPTCRRRSRRSRAWSISVFACRLRLAMCVPRPAYRTRVPTAPRLFGTVARTGTWRFASISSLYRTLRSRSVPTTNAAPDTSRPRRKEQHHRERVLLAMGLRRKRLLGGVDHPETLGHVSRGLSAGDRGGRQRRPCGRKLVVGPVHRLGEIRDLDLLVDGPVGACTGRRMRGRHTPRAPREHRRVAAGRARATTRRTARSIGSAVRLLSISNWM